MAIASTQQAIPAVHRNALPRGFSYAAVAQARGPDEDAYDADGEDCGDLQRVDDYDDDDRDDGSDCASDDSANCESHCKREGSQASAPSEDREVCRDSCSQDGRSDSEIHKEDRSKSDVEKRSG